MANHSHNHDIDETYHTNATAMWTRFTKSSLYGTVVVIAILGLMGLFLL